MRLFSFLILAAVVSSPQSIHFAYALKASSCPPDFNYTLNICGDNDFTRDNGVSRGAGSARNPHIIDGSARAWSSIGIYNTTRYFSIVNWRTEGPQSTLALVQVAHGLLHNVTVSSSGLESTPVAMTARLSRDVSINHSSFSVRGYVHDYPCPYGIGVSVSRSSDLRISNSDLYGPDEGLDVSTSSNFDLTGSSVRGGQGGGFCGGGGAFGIGFSSDVRIQGNTIHGVLVYGTWAYHDSNMSFWNNTFASTVRTGLSIFDSSSNITINENTFVYNGFGLRAFGSNISVYHNNFLYNEHQAFGDSGVSWNNGYPEGGNYWSDYKGVDNCKEAAQIDCSSEDGIGDSPYICDASADLYCGQIITGAFTNDSYPLMKPFGVTVSARMKLYPTGHPFAKGAPSLRVYVELPSDLNASIIFSSIRLNDKSTPSQAVIVASDNNESQILIVTFDVRDLREINPLVLSRPKVIQLTLSLNFLTPSHFDRLTAKSSIHLIN